MWLLLPVLLAVNIGVLDGAVSTADCGEKQLQQDAAALLAAHTDMELGGVAAGDPAIVGFQYLKPAEAFFAAQAIAHDDFDEAVTQFRSILKHQKPDGWIPHLVYGPSVPSTWKWIPSNRTFHPGPAFWPQSGAGETELMSSAEGGYNRSLLALNTSTILAPPVAADVAWELFRLAPYDTVLGVRTSAVQFLCSVYEPLRRLQKHILSTRRSSTSKGLLVSHHPWETFSSLSPHWKGFLAQLKRAPDYRTVISAIPDNARKRFAVGAASIFAVDDAVDNLYEPMVYLAAQPRGSKSDGDAESVFGVEDVEFNSLVLRSARGLVNIARVLAEHSSVCTDFASTREELQHEVGVLGEEAASVQEALVGSNATRGLWNATDEYFDDASVASSTTVNSLRGFLPAYAADLGEEKRMRVMEHFLSTSDKFHFFCTEFPAPFFTCSPEPKAATTYATMASRATPTTWPLYNYFVQRAFTRNKFPGLAEYMRNKTRDMVCAASMPTLAPRPWFRLPLIAEPTSPGIFALAFDSRSGSALDVFDDTYVGSTFAASTFLNILLPAVTPPPSPDTPPIDHRMLTVVMCIELVVAFGVAMSCFLFSVYFVANRPRESRSSSAARRSSTARKSRGRSARHREESEDQGRSSGSSWVDGYSGSSYSDERMSYSPQSGQTPYELEESLISEEDEHYGSFDGAEQQRTPPNSAMDAAREVLAAISPW